MYSVQLECGEYASRCAQDTVIGLITLLRVSNTPLSGRDPPARQGVQFENNFENKAGLLRRNVKRFRGGLVFKGS